MGIVSLSDSFPRPTKALGKTKVAGRRITASHVIDWYINDKIYCEFSAKKKDNKESIGYCWVRLNVKCPK